MTAPARFVVRGGPGCGSSIVTALHATGATRIQPLAILDGASAVVDAAQAQQLRRDPCVQEVSADAPLRLLSIGGYDPTTDAASLYSTSLIDGAQSAWRSGATGAGVDVALIDSGVAPVNGLTAANKVVNGPDLSFDGQAGTPYIDNFGHGTHMAGIIAGRDDAAAPPYAGDTNDFLGIAPDARIVNVKVADANGLCDVSQVIAALDWVVQHRHDSGLNIRVVNLSFGTDSTQPYSVDPLAFAAETAWRAGLVVVVAAGNGGAISNTLSDPAIDPDVIAVGASDTMATLAAAGGSPGTRPRRWRQSDGNLRGGVSGAPC